MHDDLSCLLLERLMINEKGCKVVLDHVSTLNAVGVLRTSVWVFKPTHTDLQGSLLDGP